MIHASNARSTPGADDSCPSADLPNDPLERIVRAYLSPVSRRIGVVGQSLANFPFRECHSTDWRIQDMYCRVCQTKRSHFERSTKCTMTVNTAATTSALPAEFP
jgi:hypothetical protein